MFWPYKIKTIKLDYNNKSFRIMFGPFDGRYTPHPNSLLYNAIPVFWPFKAFWFFRKVSPTIAVVALMLTIMICVCRPASFSSSKTSLLLPRVTPMLPSPAATSTSTPSTTEEAGHKILTRESSQKETRNETESYLRRKALAANNHVSQFSAL